MLRGLVIILIVFAIGISGAMVFSYYDRDEEPGTIEIAERMRARACAGEVQSFLGSIDKDRVEFEMKRSELKRERKDYLFSRQKEPQDSGDLHNYIHSTIPELLEIKWGIYENQLKAGDSGPICNMEIVKATSGEKTVKLKFPGGERSTWRFGKVGDEWKIVSIVDVKPLKLLTVKDRGNITPTKRKKAASEEPAGNFAADQIAADQSASLTEAQGQSQPNIPQDEDSASIVKESEETNETAAQQFGYDFRAVSWGMTPEEVSNTEAGEPAVRSPGVLSYDTYFKGEDVQVSYRFSDNRLKSGGIRFLNEHPEERFYVQDYERRRGELTARYGEPQIAEEIWYNRAYEGVPDRMGFAVAIGHLKLRTKWRTERSDILLELKSEDYDMTLVVSYHSRQRP